MHIFVPPTFKDLSKLWALSKLILWVLDFRLPKLFWPVLISFLEPSAHIEVQNYCFSAHYGSLRQAGMQDRYIFAFVTKMLLALILYINIRQKCNLLMIKLQHNAFGCFSSNMRQGEGGKPNRCDSHGNVKLLLWATRLFTVYSQCNQPFTISPSILLFANNSHAWYFTARNAISQVIQRQMFHGLANISFPGSGNSKIMI